MSRPTLAEIARRAGCSVSAASNILRGRDTLYREELVRRVHAIAQELGYQSRHKQRKLAKTRLGGIALIVDRYQAPPTRSPFATHVMDGILTYLQAADYSLKIILLAACPTEALWQQIRRKVCDGAILLTPEVNSPLLEWYQHTQLPAIVVGATLPNVYGLSCVDVDNEKGMEMLTRWVISQGHTEIAFVQGDLRHWSAHARERAFRKVLVEQRIPTREEWILPGGYSVESGRDAGRKLLQNGSLPSVVICSNDLSALGLVQELRAHNIRVPQDISVAGFDDEPLVRIQLPELTTVRNPMQMIGQMAAERLLHFIEHGFSEAPETILLPPELVVRGSVLPRHLREDAGF